MTDFNSRAAAYGLRFGEFQHLSERDRRKLERLMARMCEKAYRRGAQQGAHMAREGVIARDLHHWRFVASLDRSPWLDDPQQWNDALVRLHMENSELRYLGFRERARATA